MTQPHTIRRNTKWAIETRSVKLVIIMTYVAAFEATECLKSWYKIGSEVSKDVGELWESIDLIDNIE